MVIGALVLAVVAIAGAIVAAGDAVAVAEGAAAEAEVADAVVRTMSYQRDLDQICDDRSHHLGCRTQKDSASGTA